MKIPKHQKPFDCMILLVPNRTKKVAQGVMRLVVTVYKKKHDRVGIKFQCFTPNGKVIFL
jgi:hypothetical protein